MNERLKNEMNDQLFNAILRLESLEECYNFFEDLCTIAELHSLSQRLEIARLIDEGRPYDYIVDVTGASTATISRIKRCLVYGADGYKVVLESLKEAEAAAAAEAEAEANNQDDIEQIDNMSLEEEENTQDSLEQSEVISLEEEENTQNSIEQRETMSLNE